MISKRVIQAINSAKNYPCIIRIGVFGSCARNEETSASDIDILIEYDNSSDDFIDNIGGFMEDMERLWHGKIDYVTMTGLMKSHDEKFKRNVLNDVIWVYTTDSNVRP